jgi:hypothetical protein
MVSTSVAIQVDVLGVGLDRSQGMNSLAAISRLERFESSSFKTSGSRSVMGSNTNAPRPRACTLDGVVTGAPSASSSLPTYSSGTSPSMSGEPTSAFVSTSTFRFAEGV